MDRTSTSVFELVKAIAERRPQVVAIDGFLGAGKSTLARRLQQALGYPSVHLDDFVRRHEGRFQSNLDLRRLAESLKAEYLIVEGVCVLAVLEMLGIRQDLAAVAEKQPALSSPPLQPDRWVERIVGPRRCVVSSRRAF
jgi:hypothetical protein